MQNESEEEKEKEHDREEADEGLMWERGRGGGGRWEKGGERER